MLLPKIQSRSGFTLTELIVVIAVLSILTIIGFISLKDWNLQSRDANRISNLAIAEKAAATFISKGQLLPDPDIQKIDLTASGVFIGTQGKYGKNVSRTLGTSMINDPLDSIEFTYAINANRSQFTVVTFLEGINTLNIPGIETAYATSLVNRIPYSKGTGGGVLLVSAGLQKNMPIESLYDSSSFTGVDVITTTQAYIAVIPGKNTITGTGSVIGFVASGGGASCEDILGKDPSKRNKNGYYWINPTGSKSLRVYCDMTENGGGWMLASPDLIGSETGVSYTSSITQGSNSGAFIEVTPTKWGCGSDGPSPSQSIIIGPGIPWKTIRYTQEFTGAVSCWAIFGAKTDAPSVSASTNLNPFKIGQDSFLSSGGMSPFLNGNPVPGTNRCDNEMANFWHGNNGTGLRNATLILTKTDSTKDAALHVDASCIDLITTKWRYKDIYINCKT